MVSLWWRLVQVALWCSVILITTSMGALYYITRTTLISLASPRSLCQESVLLDDEGVVWSYLQRNQRDYVSLKQLPQHLIEAFIATEDRQFYRHSGISWYGIIRSLCCNIVQRRFAQGASTITQQLVRLTLGDTTKTFHRKLKEQLLALIVEQQYSKDQILELYLNNLYFGCGVYGIAAAAKRFWHKLPHELEIAECAVLAGIVKHPTHYCPLTQPLNALQRRNVVLSCMAHAGFISTEECARLKELPLTVVRGDTASCCAPYARDAIYQQLEAMLDPQILYRGGLTVKTTLNQTIQSQAQLCFKGSLERLRTTAGVHKDINGALVCMKVATGEIKALMGGYDYEQSQFNRATQSYRQLGSIFKPFLYAIGLEHHLSLTDVVQDEPLTLCDYGRVWEPRNVTRRFDGPMTRARGLITSNNIVAIKTLLDIGASTVSEYAQRCHLPVSQAYPALALGCIDATVTQAAGMFNIFANKGTYVEPHLIQWVKDASGTIIWQATPRTRAIFSWRTCSNIIYLLKQAVEQLIAYTHAAPLRCAAAGKTGTTNEARNCWFAGSTPTYTTVVYLGTDDYASLGNIYALRSTFPLWLAFNASIEQPVRHFLYDPVLKPCCIDATTGEVLQVAQRNSLELLQVVRKDTDGVDRPDADESLPNAGDYDAQLPEHWLPDDA